MSSLDSDRILKLHAELIHKTDPIHGTVGPLIIKCSSNLVANQLFMEVPVPLELSL